MPRAKSALAYLPFAVSITPMKRVRTTHLEGSHIIHQSPHPFPNVSCSVRPVVPALYCVYRTSGTMHLPTVVLCLPVCLLLYR
ncbi:hypothetical protein K523DRAFT_325924 [Schizophyllum commune Tattone D]|nr:hypothetical protein K523DRAFT_325924 [Schizophyllum commune Tattone D]